MSSISFKGLCFCFFLFSVCVVAQCPNGCSQRGLCINNVCVCAEGLSGSDCSVSAATTSNPTLYQCPECYTITVGPPRYYSGPSWRLPDGPIVGLNYYGNLSVYQGNGDGELMSEGSYIENFIPSPIVALQPGTAGNFDSCGSWIMRAFTIATGEVLGFYHAETSCVYSNNGQTRKSGGYSVSNNGGITFTKPSYPNNKLIDTSTPVIIGEPTGEGDYGVIVRGGYYYLYFSDVEDYSIGVARSVLSSNAYPGSFYKYYNGQWNSPGVGGNSSKLVNISGAQIYLHTPSQSIVSIGNTNPYWNEGFMMSVSDDGINWQYFADPIFTPDPITNLDDVEYPSFLGPTGGYDIGSKFKFFYMWVPPGLSWNYRYQIYKDITLTYTGINNTAPLAKIALTTYKYAGSGETWQTTELVLPPYKPVNIAGYLMSRAYPGTFVVYDCYNYTTNDHFVGTSSECFLSGPGIVVTRTLGYMWSYRASPCIAIYRCYAGSDLFLSSDTNCGGLAAPQTIPFGYVMDGPPYVLTTEVLVSQGSHWKYYNKSSAPAGWTQPSFNDSAWAIGQTPFGDSYSTVVSFFGTRNYYFRSSFIILPGNVVQKLLLSVASDDYAIVYINGVLVDSDSVAWHEAAYWNRNVYVNTSMLVTGNNTISVIGINSDVWAFFDLQLVATYYTASSSFSSQSSRSVWSVEEEQEVPDEEQVEAPQVPNDQKFRPRLETRDSSAYTTLIAPGSNWRYYNISAPASTWTQLTYDDSSWPMGLSPFVTGYSAYVGVGTAFGTRDYYFRLPFSIAAGKTVQNLMLYVASDNYGIVYINGILVDLDPAAWHQATYWNREINVDSSVLNNGINIIAVVVKNMDQWAFFDLQLSVQYAPDGMLISPGSTWWYYNGTAPGSTWNQLGYVNSAWTRSVSPFVTGYSAYVGVGTPFGATNYYFRYYFTIPTGKVVKSLQVYIASDNTGATYINGILVDSDPASWHQAAYWNRQVVVDPATLVTGINVVAVEVFNMDQWAFFDLQLNATYVNMQSLNATLIAPGSYWSYYNASTPAGTWIQPSFNDSSWARAIAPFVTGYSAFVGKGTPFGMTNYYFRSKFTIPSGVTISSMQLSVASDNYGIVYINGMVVDSDPADWHQAMYWNRQLNIDTSMIVAGNNTIAVVVMNMDQWAFFDLQLTVVYGAPQSTIAVDGCNPVCGVMGQCINKVCVCDNGWSGADCTTNLCTYTAVSTEMVVPSGSSYRTTQWSYIPSTPVGWFSPAFDDSWWIIESAPFGTSGYSGVTTYISATRRLYRKSFIIDVPYNKAIQFAYLYVASDDTHRVYVNGMFVGAPIYPYNPHTAHHWNAIITVDGSLLVNGINTIAVEVPLVNAGWTTFFDSQLNVTYSTRTCTAPS